MAGCFITMPPCCPEGSDSCTCIHCYGDEAPCCLLIEIADIRNRTYRVTDPDDEGHQCFRFCDRLNGVFRLAYTGGCAWSSNCSTYENGPRDCGTQVGSGGSWFAQLGITEDGDYVLIVGGSSNLCGSWSYNFGPNKPDCMAWEQLELTRGPECDPTEFYDANCDYSYATCKVTALASDDTCETFDCDVLPDTECAPVGEGCCCDSASSWAVDLGDGGWAAGDACLEGCEGVQGIYIVPCCRPTALGVCSEDSIYIEYYDCYESSFWADHCAFGTNNVLQLNILVHSGPSNPGYATPDEVFTLMLEESCCAIYVEIWLQHGAFIGETFIPAGVAPSYAAYRATNIEPDGADVCVGPYTLQKIYEDHPVLDDPGHACNGSRVCTGYLPDTITIQGA